MTRKTLLVTLFVLALTLAVAVAALAVTATQGVLTTPATPWQTLSSPPGGALSVFAASPAFSADHVLLAGTPGGLYRSDTAGHSWNALGAGPAGPITTAHKIVPSPAFSSDHTLFVLAGPYGVALRTVLRSTDDGVTWQTLSAPGPSYDLAISPSFATDRTLWATYREIEGSGERPESGIVRSIDAGANIYSYFSANQRISIPANATSAELTFNRYPILGDTEAVGKDQVEAANLLEAGPEVDDYQYLLALFDDGSYQLLRTWRSNDRTWLATTVDLRGLAGRSFRVQFGTFNNGTGGIERDGRRRGRPVDLRAAASLPAPPPADLAHRLRPHPDRYAYRYALVDAVPYANRNRHALVDADNDSWDHSHRHTGRGAKAHVAA